jgi:hypothetical protein
MRSAGQVVDRLAEPAAWISQCATAERTRCNIEALICRFDEWVWRFEASGLFTGPSVHFHERALQRRRGHRSAAALLTDDLFLEYVYAVLPAWGNYRMDCPPGAVTEFSLLVASLRSAAPTIEQLWPLSLRTLPPDRVPEVGRLLWQVITSIRACTSEVGLAAGSMVLHHVLPDLIPPMDRKYTVRFFAARNALAGGTDLAFLEWFPYLVEIGHRCGGVIDAVAGREGYMATGPAKIIDNAIIGFVQAHDTQPYAW